jgi:hypothetical protein
MIRRAAVVPFLALALLTVPGCKSDPEPEAKADKAAEKAPEAPPPDTTPAEPQFDLTGPKPPETSSVVFSVDGALLPLACFDKAKNALLSGSECAGLVGEGSEVYMESSFGKKALEKTGSGTAMSTCGDEGAIPTAALSAGADYDWAVWPKSVAPTFEQLSPDTWSDRGARLEDAEAKAIQDAIAKVRDAKGDFLPKQKASLDVDGDGKKELFVSAVLISPSDPDTYLFSGLFMAPGGDLGNIQLIDRTKKGTDVIKLFGAVDLDGDGKRELWTGIAFEGGAGERIVQLGSEPGAEPKPLGKWTCGAGA